MDKSSIVKSAVKASKTKSKSNAQNVNVVNTPEVTIKQSALDKPEPTLRLDSSVLPAIKNWKVGSKYKLVLEVQQTSLSQGNEYEIVDRPSTLTNASFKVLSVKEG